MLALNSDRNMRALPVFMILASVSLACLGCDDANASASGDENVSPAGNAAVATNADLPTVLVYKTPTCGCCNGWIEHLEAAGFTVDARDVSDIMTIKRDGGVPPQMSSCHTAIVDGYVVEGHVPAEQMKDLLANRPDIAGIAVPGMPVGSPGMEGPNAKPYQVLSFTHDGQAAVYADVVPR